ncbi:MAG: Ig-like domain-containing protein [Gammaproteobacteria bacterium]|nr:Ig-like domain-containing protein [Gammaproteobacteria bacterium]
MTTILTISMRIRCAFAAVNGDAANVTAVDATSSEQVVVATAGGAGVIVDEEGGFTYNPSGAFEFLAANEMATDFFTYTVVDSTGLDGRPDGHIHDRRRQRCARVGRG